MGVGKLDLDAVEEPLERRSVGDVEGVSAAAAAGEHAAHVAVDVDDGRAGIAALGEDFGFGFVAVAENRPLERVSLDGPAPGPVPPHDRECAVGAPNSGARGVAVFDDEETRLAILAHHVGMAHALVVDDALDAKETVGWVLEGPTGLRAAEAHIRKVRRRDVGVYVYYLLSRCPRGQQPYQLPLI